MPPPPPLGTRARSAAKSRRERRRPIKAVYVHADDGEGNWLVSYADLMTLLFGFFVMLSAFSTPNSEKFEKMRQETTKQMGGEVTKPYEELTQAIRKVFSDMQLDKEVGLLETLDGVKITTQGTVFFDSGSAQLKESAQTILSNLADVLSREAKGFRIVVEGHTDDVPIRSQMFPSNWELSSARAGSVVRMLEEKGFPRSDLRPLGLADTEPLAPNRDPSGVAIPENQTGNRRIVIRIQKTLGR